MKEPTVDNDEKAIFLEALEQATTDRRDAYIAKACSDNAELLNRVKELLAAHDGSLGPLDSPPLGSAETPTIDEFVVAQPGTLIGPYKLREKIGEGGMGLVYVADQKQPVRRRVALKIIKPGMDSQQVIARFEAERQALAMMDHPNIAKVFDAGTTDHGRPYFVMELVNGISITNYCDQKQLNPQERVELFIPVCLAVQHAHQKGIIHRDLKPSNILVAMYDGRPVPKVIDFGVAKATNQALFAQTVYTQLDQLVGTLEYMSPEQAGRNQLDIDTRSDIYSLGVVLYELLTGATPFERKRLRSAAFDEILRIIREEEPPKPSTKLSSSQSLSEVADSRHTEPKKLTALVRGELDWIVMKALDKERSRRYETASDFAADMQHYLCDEPVVACPPSAAYRFRKFARRNKTPIAMALVAVFTLIAVAIGSLIVAVEFQSLAKHNSELAGDLTKALSNSQKNLEFAQAEQKRAEENFLKALSAVDEFLSQVGAEELATVPHFEPVRRKLLLKALQFFEDFLQEKGDDPTVRFETGLAHRRVAEIQQLLGDDQKAIEAFDQAIKVLEMPGEDKSVQIRHQQALAWMGKGLSQKETGQRKPAAASLERARGMSEGLVESNPENLEYRQDLSRVCGFLGQLYMRAGENEAARRTLQQGVSVLEEIIETDPGGMESIRLLLQCYNKLGLLNRYTTKSEQALAAFRRASEIVKTVEPQKQDDLFRYTQNMVEVNLGLTLIQYGESAEGEQLLLNAIEVGKDLVADFPSVPKYRFGLHAWHSNFGGFLLGKQRFAEARLHLEDAVSVVQNLATDFPKVVKYQTGLGSALNDLSTVYSVNKEYALVSNTLKQAVTAQQTALKLDPNDKVARRFLSNHLHNLAIALRDLKAPLEETISVHQQEVNETNKLLSSNPESAQFQNQLGSAFHIWADTVQEHGDLDQAVELTEKAVEHLEFAHRHDPKTIPYLKELSRARLKLVLLYDELEKPTPESVVEQWLIDTRKWVMRTSRPIPWSSQEVSQLTIDKINDLRADLGGKDVRDWLFLAALYHHVEKHDQAQQWFEKAEDHFQNNDDQDPAINRFRVRVAKFLGRIEDANH